MENNTRQQLDIRKNDGGCALRENNFSAQSIDQDSDCWSDLWQHVKIKSLQFLINKAP